jgi:organic radical activating enzyme
MRKLIELKNTNVRTLRINYDLGNLCNYKCWYCFPEANTGTVKFPNLDVVKKNIVSLINYYLKSGIVNEVKLSLTGGEPTLWKELGEFVEYVKTNSKCLIYVITNGSKSLDWWDRYSQHFDSVNISVHHEKVDLEHIKNLTSLLYQKNICFYTEVMMDHDHWDKCLDIVNSLCDTEIQFMVLSKPVHINGLTYYNEDQRVFLQDHLKRKPSQDIINNHLEKFQNISKISAYFDTGDSIEITNENYFIVNMMNNFQGWSCNLGVNYLFIDRQGNLSGTCKQRLYGLSYDHNINDPHFINTFSPEIKPVICEQSLCLCPGETALTKKKI